MIRPILNARLDGASTIPATGTLTAASGSTVDLSLATVTLPASITSTFFDFKGNQSASGNPNYPAGSKGDVYYISVAGKVGGASGKTVTVGDMLICSADNAGGTEASVGTSWFVTESNLDMTNVAITGGSITGITDITVADGGTGRSTGTTAYALVATGTTATGAQQTLASGATTELLVGGGASALPVWTTATGTGAPVRGTSPTITTSLLCADASFTAFAGATTLLTIGGTGASASMFAPSTLDTTSSTTGAIRTSGGISAEKALNIGTTGTFGGQIVTIAGAVGTPSIAPTGDSNTGIWFPAADKIAASVAGVRALTIEVGGTTSRMGLNSTSPAGTFHIVKDSASSVPFRISNAANTEHLDCYPPTSDGTTTAAAWGTASNHNFGIFTNNSGWWALFTTDKYLRFPSGAGGLGIKNADGTVSIPSYTFESDTNTGMYRIGADQIGFAANGVLQLTINTTGITAAGTLAVTGATTLTGLLTANGGITLGDAQNIAFNTTTGTKIGAATTQKLSFWNATPIVQPTTAVASATVASPGGGVNIKTDDTFDGYTIAQVVKALRNAGLLA